MTRMILHPTRGGRASHPNQNWVIEYAKKTGAELVFLYVSNVEFLGQSMMPKLVDLEAELDEMGDFLLAMAQERAEKEGVKAQAVVRHGKFDQVLKEVIGDYPVDLVIVGSSLPTTGVTTREYIEALAQEISDHAEVGFIVLYDGEVLLKYGVE